MRKTQVALAALALVASTAALADVSIYGTADVNIVNKDAGTSLGGGGNSAGSIFGFKGSEDLGNGLKASFLLEGGFSAATGQYANGGAATGPFNRQAYVGLGNETIEVKTGFQISPFITGALTGAAGLGGNGVFVPGLTRMFGNLAPVTGTNDTDPAAGVATGGFFIPDAINVSINASGITANLMSRVKKAGDGYTAASLTTTVGGINLAGAYQKITVVADSTTVTNYFVGGNTNIGDVTVSAGLGRTSGTAHSDYNGSSYTVGASMPLVGALSGGVQYFKTADTAGSGNQTSLSLKYTMSKQTYAYMNYSHFSVASEGILAANDNGTFNEDDAATKRLIGVGIVHSF